MIEICQVLQTGVPKYVWVILEATLNRNKKKIQGFRDKRSIQQEEESFRQHIGLKVKEETTAKLHFEHGFVWC